MDCKEENQCQKEINAYNFFIAITLFVSCAQSRFESFKKADICHGNIIYGAFWKFLHRSFEALRHELSIWRLAWVKNDLLYLCIRCKGLFMIVNFCLFFEFLKGLCPRVIKSGRSKSIGNVIKGKFGNKEVIKGDLKYSL